MKNMKLVIAFLVVALVGAGVAGGAVWWMSKKNPKEASASAAAETEKVPETGKKSRRYLTVEKVIVMLKRSPTDTESHYLSTDLVVTTTEEQEKHCKDHLPLLRSIAVRALSSYPMEKAQTMTVEQITEQLNRAFDAEYASEKAEKPFSEVMLGKLIIE
jgi:flagellar FliL protein